LFIRNLLPGCTAVAALTAALASSATAQTPKNMQLEIHQTQVVDGKSMPSTTKLWKAGPDHLRFDITARGLTQSTIVSGLDAWTIISTQKTGFHRKLTPAQAERMRSNDPLVAMSVKTFLKMGGKKAGQEPINGVPCTMYRLVDPRGLTATLWAQSAPPELPMRTVREGKVSMAAAKGQPAQPHAFHDQADFTWTVGKPISMALFTPPAGVAIRELPDPTAGVKPAMPHK